MIIVSTPKRELLYWITKLTTSGDTYYEVYDPSSSYYLLYGYDYDCNGDIVWSVWDMPGSEWIELEDGCVEATEVSGYRKGDRKDAKNEPPLKKERNAKKKQWKQRE